MPATTRKVLNQDWDPGSWTSESGNALLEQRWQMQSSTQWWWIWARFFLETVCSWAHMPTAQLFVQPSYSGVTPLETLERIRPRLLEMERVHMMTGCKLILSREERERAKVKTNTREEIARPARPTRALHTSTRARTVANLNIGRKTAGILVEERMTIPPTEVLAKARVNTHARERQTRGRCRNRTTSAFWNSLNRVVSFARSECYWRTLVHFKRGPVDHRCDTQFRVIHKETSWCRVFASWQWRSVWCQLQTCRRRGPVGETLSPRVESSTYSASITRCRGRDSQVEGNGCHNGGWTRAELDGWMQRRNDELLEALELRDGQGVPELTSRLLDVVEMSELMGVMIPWEWGGTGWTECELEKPTTYPGRTTAPTLSFTPWYIRRQSSWELACLTLAYCRALTDAKGCAKAPGTSRVGSRPWQWRGVGWWRCSARGLARPVVLASGSDSSFRSFFVWKVCLWKRPHERPLVRLKRM